LNLDQQVLLLAAALEAALVVADVAPLVDPLVAVDESLLERTVFVDLVPSFFQLVCSWQSRIDET
jgi:non-ribosomal peptide synthetase component F